MKKIITSSVFLLLFFNTIHSQSWEYVGNRRFTGKIYQNNFTFDVAGNASPMVFFKENSQSNRAQSKKFDGTSWVSLVPLGPGSEKNFSLRIDNNDEAIIVFSAVRGYAHKYLTNGWSYLGGGNGIFSSNVPEYLNLSISKTSNTPYIVFASPNNGKASVRKFNNSTSSWETLGTLSFTSSRANYTNIAINTNESVYIAFQDNSVSKKVSVMKFDGTNWVYVGTSGFSEGKAKYVSIAINQDNDVYVIYTDDGLGSKPVVKKFDGTDWIVVGNETTVSTSYSYFTNMVFSSSNIPYIAFKDYTNGKGGKASVLRFVNNSWEPVGTLGFTDGQANKIKLAFDANNQLFIGFSDYNNTDFRASVMKFDISSLGVEKNLNKNDIAIISNQSTKTVRIRTLIQIKKIYLYSILGKEKIVQKGKTIDVAHLKNGFYFLKIISSDNSVYLKKIII